MKRYALLAGMLLGVVVSGSCFAQQVVELDGQALGPKFEGIGVVNGGGATSVLLKDYPEPQRSQILDMVYKPKFGASVSALMVEVPGDGNSTQGSMPSHSHTRDDLNFQRGYTWWILREAKRRNPKLSIDAAAWSAPGWLGNGEFWSQDTADYYVQWVEGLRREYGIKLDALGCRNEKGVSFEFAKMLRKSLDTAGLEDVRIHAFDHWPDYKFDFVPQMLDDPESQEAIDIIGAHVMYCRMHASPEVQQMAADMNKPIWNTEDHVYLRGFECLISIVECFNDNYIHSNATRVVNWYDIGGTYAMEPYADEPPMVLAHNPWSGHYRVRQSLWGYAHYGQFTEVGWRYLNGGCGELALGGSCVAMKSPDGNYSLMIETKDATGPQQVEFRVGGGLPQGKLCVWRSNAAQQFVEQAAVMPEDGRFTLQLEPNSVYSLSTTTGQQKGEFDDIPEPAAFPFPYRDDFESYSPHATYGYLPRYMADIEEAFELVARPDGQGSCLRQVVPRWPLSWAPSWQPYTIVGDDQWHDYEVSADLSLNQGDTAAVMGRVNDVGSGYGTIPKGYYAELSSTGACRLVVTRGKRNKKQVVGDAEQQALIQKANDESLGGELVLGTVQLDQVKPGEWYQLTLRMVGPQLTVLVEGKPVIETTDATYATGMAGLMARQIDRKRLSTPYFDNLTINEPSAATPAATEPASGYKALYSTGDE